MAAPDCYYLKGRKMLTKFLIVSSVALSITNHLSLTYQHLCLCCLQSITSLIECRAEHSVLLLNLFQITYAYSRSSTAWRWRGSQIVCWNSWLQLRWLMAKCKTQRGDSQVKAGVQWSINWSLLHQTEHYSQMTYAEHRQAQTRTKTHA